MEIAIRQVKDGQEAAFAQARAAFISKLTQQSGVEQDWEFHSFFTLPKPDRSDVFVGMTRYASAAAMQTIADAILASPEAGQFFSTFDMKAFVAVQPVDDSDFRLEELINPGNVLEVAVRTVHPEQVAEFEPRRAAFFELIAQQQGYLFDQEFVDLQTGDQVVLIGWESQEAFQAAAVYLQSQPQMGEFFSILEVKAYQALQFHSPE